MANPIIPWIGGKRRLAPQILPLFNNQHTCYVEPFVGAGALFFMKRPSEVEVINDVNGELVNLYRVVKHHLEEFMRQFKYALSSRQIFEWMKMTVPETLTDIQRAARFLYLQKLSFGARVEGQSYGTATTSGPRLSQAHIEHLSWRDCALRYDRPHTLTYCDPPYWQTEGYGVEFDWEQYEQLADFARSAEGTVIISVNDHPDMRAVFSDLETRSVEITYTVGGGSNSAPRNELIIGNWSDGWPALSGTQEALFEDQFNSL